MASPLDPNDPLQAAGDPLQAGGDPFAQDPFAQAQPADGADPMQAMAGDDMPLPMVPTGGAVRKQRFNIYSMLLILSAICLAIASLCLHLEVQEYGDPKAPWSGASSTKVRG